MPFEMKQITLTSRRAKSLVGLEIEAGSVAAAEIRSGGSGQLSKSAIAPLPSGAVHDGEIVDPDAVASVLRDVFAENKLSKQVRLGIANQSVVVRTMRLPAIDDPKELDVAVRFQAQEQIPMPLDQAVLDHRVVGGIPATEDSGPMIDVILVAARRDMIDASMQLLRKAGLQPAGIDLSAFGLIRALGSSALPAGEDEGEESSVDASAILYCNIGETTNLAVAKRRSCLFTRVAPAGLGAIEGNLVAATGMAPEHAAPWLHHVGLSQLPEQIDGDPPTILATRSALETGVADLQSELRLSLDFYAAGEGSAPIDHVVLSGPASAIPGFAEAIEAGFSSLPFEVSRPAALASLDPASAARLTLSYGLALDS
ncbi:MAG TPA: type IV pilus assembly protein PilM [Solirubrobacterales bacterium]|jgi:type IV pilus assembly protein PilM|nr:type IV pilus assembly protein PilM [Solirubrobacterales bacterium]